MADPGWVAVAVVVFLTVAAVVTGIRLLRHTRSGRVTFEWRITHNGERHSDTRLGNGRDPTTPHPQPRQRQPDHEPDE